MGVYWQSIGRKKEKVVDNRVWYDEYAEMELGNADGLFISWAFLEEEILNKELGFVFDADDFGGSFNSVNSFITYEPSLVEKQRFYKN